MAVVSLNSTLFRADMGPAIDHLVVRARPHRATGRVLNAASDSALSTYKLIELPSHVILLDRTFFDVENWGFATVRIGTLDDDDALLTVARSAATTQKPITERIAAQGNRLWQTLGMAADPQGVIALYAHGPAAATGAGVMPFVVEWADNV